MTHKKNRLAALLPAAIAALWACTPVQRAEVAGLKYPPAPRGTTVDDYHGTKVADPYRGFESLDSPATRAWTGPWRLRSCPRHSRPIATASSVSRRKHAPPPV